MSAKIQYKPHMNPYDYHKYLINEYVLLKPGDTKILQKKNEGNYKTDKDIILDNMQFIWNEEDLPKTYEEKLAKKYYDKLFREYVICDLSKYKENKIGNRFRVEKEVIVGKGQFICGEKSCSENTNLRTWEVNFAYAEKGERKNALVKIRLCESCSDKLNYHSKKREIKRLKRTKPRTTIQKESREPTLNPQSTLISSPRTSSSHDRDDLLLIINEQVDSNVEENLWKKSNESEVRGRDEEFDDYLADLLL